MQFEALAEDVRAWLKEAVENGRPPPAVVKSLQDSGFEPDFAHIATEQAFARFASPLAKVSVVKVAPLRPFSSSSLLAGARNVIETSDRTVRILLALNEPRIVLLGGLLSDDECDRMIELARGKLQRSTVVNEKSGVYDVHPDRTSEGTYFPRGENELVSRVERRIAEALGYPVENGEPIQVLHYNPGAQYKPHFDYFDPQHPGNAPMLAMGGQRVATVVMYLNDVEGGGSTVFPTVGADVLPHKGNAAFFLSTDAAGRLQPATLHGGSPVAQGEKWIATKWLREGPYTGTG